ncbi:multicopper oxidase family protein [Clostridium cuniculi]|uniref:multicopper oxidase family protein n=1 Tax=Clostridium cuniculi TaxID=2548455 RepID=UPI0018AB21C1|nr:multicopper oxidase [Clostridium cuniculi]
MLYDNDCSKTKVDPSNADSITKFADELPIPVTAKPINNCGCDNLNCKDKSNHYKITMKESYHKFHSDFPETYIWGYNGLYPGPTIEAFKDIPVYVEWANNLPDKHFLPFDTTLHGTQDDPEVRTVVHLHGAKVAWESDGHPEAWYTADYKITGSKFTRKIYEYTNHQPGLTMWYHDHAMGVTRLNVYAGLAGFYILRDSLEERLNLPKGDYEIPLLIQDKSFNSDGSLFYPDSSPFVDFTPSIPLAFLGNTIVVNGKVWPYLEVEPRKYRFRILNGSNRRVYNFSFDNNAEFSQIGTDGGFIEAPVTLSSFVLDPAERIDVIVDFSKYEGSTFNLVNTNVDADSNTGVIMQFRVTKALKCEDTSTIPKTLRHVPELDESAAKIERFIPLIPALDHFGRPMLMIDNKMWSDPVSEKPELDTIEVWNIINTFSDLNIDHPIHLHLIQFKLISRTPFDVDIYNKTGIIVPTGDIEEPKDYERGFKDTVNAEAGKVTKFIVHFTGFPGEYVWHCHFLEHEDHDMMRPMKVVDNSFIAK